MTNLRRQLRAPLTCAFAIVSWLVLEQSASAQVLFAQSGAAKTAVGWLLVLLALVLGLIVVCRPSRRKPLDDRR